MKAQFPRVAAGFSVGFAVGGIAAAALVGPLGGPEHLLGLDVLAAGLMLGLVLMTARQFPADLRAAPERVRTHARVPGHRGVPPVAGPAGQPAGRADPGLPAALGRGHPAARLHGVGTGRRPIPRPERAGTVPGRVRRDHQRGQRAVRGDARGVDADPLRARPRPGGQPARRAGPAGRDGGRRVPRRAGRARVLRPGVCPAGHRHHAHRWQHPHVDQRDVPGAPAAGAGPRPDPGRGCGRAAGARVRRDPADRVRRARARRPGGRGDHPAAQRACGSSPPRWPTGSTA